MLNFGASKPRVKGGTWAPWGPPGSAPGMYSSMHCDRHPPGRHPNGRYPHGRHPLARHPLADTPRQTNPPTATVADGTHPTGMDSCLRYYLYLQVIITLTQRFYHQLGTESFFMSLKNFYTYFFSFQVGQTY